MGFLRGFGAFWYDLIIGDDWKIAVGVVFVLVVGLLAILAGASGSAVLPPVLAVLFGGAFITVMAVDVRKSPQ